MPTAHLAFARQASPPAVFRYLNGTVTQVGNTFGTAEAAVSSPGADMNTQRACQFKGSNDLYALNRDDVYQYNKGTGNWTSVHTLTAPSLNGKSPRVGPVVMQVNGVPTLVVAYQSQAVNTAWRFATSVDGTTWNTSGNLIGPVHSILELAIWNPIVVGQTLWFFTTDSGSQAYIYGINPTIGTLTTVLCRAVITPNFASTFYLSQCVWNGVHYVVGLSPANNGDAVLYSFSGASFTTVATLNQVASLTGIAAGFDQKHASFVYGDDLIVLTWGRYTGAGFLGWYVWRVQPGLVITDITAATMPSSLSAYVSPNKPQDGGWGVLVDQESNPGGVPEIYLYYRSNGTSGTPWAVYKWNGFATLMGNAGAPTGSGGDGSHCMAFDMLGSGKLFYTEDELDVSIESIVQALGGQTISFRLYSASGTEVVDVDFFYNDEGESAKTGPASILNASAGTIVANQITGLTADNGATLYTVLWDTTGTGDNVPNGTEANLQARVSV